MRPAASRPLPLAEARRPPQAAKQVHPQLLQLEDVQSLAPKAAGCRWQASKRLLAERSTALDAAEAQSCAAPAWQPPAAQAQRAPKVERQLPSRQPQWVKLASPHHQPADEPPQPALQAAPETALAVLLPVFWPESPSTHRRAWRYWRGRSWDDSPAPCASLPTRSTPQNAIHGQNSHEPARPHALQWNSNGSCLRPDPWIPERRESVYS